ncbi:MAG: phytanoyl-CoA dioxygenase family protein [Pseudomonadota bacterium]
MALSQSQIEFYTANGYLVVENLIDEVTLQRLRAAIDEFNEQSRQVTQSDDVFDVAPGHTAETPKLRRIKHPTDQHPTFDALMRAPLLVDLVADLLGGTVRFDHSKLNFKPPGGGAKIEWHQDWAFYPHTNDDLLAVGVMVEDCTPENGPLNVIPRSHRGPLYDHHDNGVFAGGIKPETLGGIADQAVELTAPAGSISIHHVRTLHASSENQSTLTRPLLLFSFAAVDAMPVFKAPDFEDFDSRILRGEPTLTARVTDVPIRLPFPKAEGEGSIFDNQAKLAASAQAGSGMENRAGTT